MHFSPKGEGKREPLDAKIWLRARSALGVVVILSTSVHFKTISASKQGERGAMDINVDYKKTKRAVSCKWAAS